MPPSWNTAAAGRAIELPESDIFATPYCIKSHCHPLGRTSRNTNFCRYDFWRLLCDYTNVTDRLRHKCVGFSKQVFRTKVQYPPRCRMSRIVAFGWSTGSCDDVLLCSFVPAWWRRTFMPATNQARVGTLSRDKVWRAGSRNPSMRSKH